MWPNDKSVIDVSEQDSWTEIGCGNGRLLELFHEDVNKDWGYRRSHGGPADLLEVLLSPLEAGRGDAGDKQFLDLVWCEVCVLLK